jgi:glycosyltransferase involved in cell wall biosynthesis
VSDKLKSILYIANSPQAYPASGGRTRIISVARLHQSLGYKTQIVSFVSLKLFFFNLSLLKRARKALAEEANSKVIYLPSIPTFGSTLLLKLRDWVSWMLITNTGKNFCILHGHGLQAAYIALRSSYKLQKKPIVVADIHGASPEEAMFAKNISKKHPLIEVLNKKEKEVYNKADLSIFVSRRMVNHIEKKFGHLPKNHIVIPCATESPSYLDSVDEIKKDLGITDQYTFAYLGSYRKYQMAKETIQLFKSITNKITNCKLVIFTSHISEFRDELNRQGIPASSFTIKTLERADVPRYLQAVDIGLMLRSDETLNKVASPTKFAEYLIAGVPVITTPYVGDYSDLVKTEGIGYITNSYSCTPDLELFINEVKINRQKYREKCIQVSSQQLTWASVKDIYQEALSAI